MASPPVAREHLPYPVLLAAAWSACLLLIAGGGWLLGQAIGRLSVIIAPVAIAVLLAVMLRPLVDRIPQRVPRAAAALVVVGVMAGTYLFGIVGALFAVPVTAMANTIVRYLAARGDGERGARAARAGVGAHRYAQRCRPRVRAPADHAVPGRPRRHVHRGVRTSRRGRSPRAPRPVRGMHRRRRRQRPRTRSPAWPRA